MNTLDNIKFAKTLAPISANGGAYTCTAVDTLGFNHAHVVIMVGVIGADATGVKVTECETSGGSYSDITGATFTLTTATSAGTIHVCSIKLQKRMRYLKLAATAGAGATLLGSVILLSRANQTPNTNAERGVEATVGWVTPV